MAGGIPERASFFSLLQQLDDPQTARAAAVELGGESVLNTHEVNVALYGENLNGDRLPQLLRAIDEEKQLQYSDDPDLNYA